MRVVAGLGNPGSHYVWTRHNVGFMVIEALSRRWRIPLSSRDGARSATVHRSGSPVLLVQPLRFMNHSGEVLAGIIDASGVEAMTVVYDDVDLPRGRIRIRRGGGSGGHRGVASIIECCGREFTRVRVGVGRPSETSETADYVLAPLNMEERTAIEESAQLAADAVECLLEEGIEVAMNRFNAHVASNEDAGVDRGVPHA